MCLLLTVGVLGFDGLCGLFVSKFIRTLTNNVRSLG